MKFLLPKIIVSQEFNYSLVFYLKINRKILFFRIDIFVFTLFYVFHYSRLICTACDTYLPPQTIDNFEPPPLRRLNLLKNKHPDDF